MQFRTETEILNQMLMYAQEQGLIETSDELVSAVANGQRTENQYVLDLASHAYVLSQLEQEVSIVYDNMFLNTATGEFLDRIGALVNVARYPPQAGKVELVISAPISLEEDVTIPAGTTCITGSQNNVYGEYVTTEEVVLHAYTENVSVIAECVDLGFGPRLPEGAVTGFVGIQNLSVTNPEEGTPGKNMENDDEYRIRIYEWAAATQLGSKTCIENYLNQYDGISSYALEACYDGVGTLHIIADTLTSSLESIRDDVYNNCMLISDIAPLVTLPDKISLPTLTFNVKLTSNITMSLDELKELIAAQVIVFIGGGNTRIGNSISGLGVGKSFEPSQCIQYLLTQFPEIINIYCDDMDTVEIDVTEQLIPGEVAIVWLE